MAQAPKSLQPSPEVEVKEEKTIFDFFGKKEPAHVGAGVGMGLRSIAKGVFAGAAGLVMQPVVGFERGGVLGFSRGVAKGLAGAVILPVAGVGFGISQIGRGIVNTPESVRKLLERDEEVEKAAAKVDLTESETKEAIVLDENLYSDARKKVMDSALLHAVEKTGHPKKTGSGSLKTQLSGKSDKSDKSEKSDKEEKKLGKEETSLVGHVKETDLYDVLGVDPAADPLVIKKAYYKLARESHPDKHPNDAVAKERFQLVGEAYQVLSDPERREKYDRHGKASLDEAFMDPGSFFTMAFGADQFKHLVGELTVAYTAAREVSEAELKEFQRRREEDLATRLKQRLQTWVDGFKEKFLEEALAEVEELRDQPFGEAMLHSIGYTYEKKADVLLGLHHTALGIPGHIAVLRQHGHVFATKYRAASAALKMQDLKKKIDKESPEEQARLSAESLPVFLDSIWVVSVLDIESTLRHVVTKVVVDETVSKEVRRERAKGLIKLGRSFQQA